jgi:cell division protein FtsL
MTDHDFLKRQLEQELAANPDAMAAEIMELRKSEKWMLWGLAIVAFFVWLLMVSRGPNRY